VLGRAVGAICGALLLLLTGAGPGKGAAEKKAETAPKEDPVLAARGAITAAAWRSASTAPLRPGEIDQLIDRELARLGVQPAAPLSDEQFVRRVYLDLTGRLPLPADITEFLADRDPARRARLIDQLLDSPEYAGHWARYWRDVIVARSTDPRSRLFVRHFEHWLTEQLRNNVSWAQITRAMLTAGGELRFGRPDENGAAFFLLSHLGADAVTERAAETARVFLGIQLQCAQCHDHPFDDWKQTQFHELAAYFARTKERPVAESKKLAGYKLVSLPLAEHRLIDKDDPTRGRVIQPRFLDGKSPGARLSDGQRRSALARAVTSPADPWFAAAYVNRIWGVLLGQAFYEPVDDLGPQREAVFPTVLPRLAASFRGSNFDVKALFRAILNSQAYQRQSRLGHAPDEHLLFAAVYPTRLSADALWEALVSVLGKMPAPPPKEGKKAGPYQVKRGLEGLLLREFRSDPSARAEDGEGSIPQALLLMNNPRVNQRIQAKGTNLLARILKAYPEDGGALTMVYLRTLARRPTDREMSRCLEYVRRTGNRAEAFEDILWALLNSTEFLTRR
jgi:hypothetical protein